VICCRRDCTGVRSSRQIERKTYEDVGFRVIAGGAQPDHSCISELRRLHLEEFIRLFGQILGLCREAGLVKLGHVAIDGTKVKANASKHKAMSYDRMKKDEQRWRDVVRDTVREAEEADADGKRWQTDTEGAAQLYRRRQPNHGERRRLPAGGQLPAGRRRIAPDHRRAGAHQPTARLRAPATPPGGGRAQLRRDTEDGNRG